MDDKLTLDAGLSSSIQYSPRFDPPDFRPRVALLTGATGFLGVNLLRDLLACTSMEVVCLVRPSSEAGGVDRLRFVLQSHGLWRTEFAGRLCAIEGDIAEPRLGLSDHEFFLLGKRVDVVYHNAAQINLVLPYRALRTTNVLGTLELLRLAAIAPVRAFHHVSSLAVFGLDGSELQSEIKEDFCVGFSPRITSGYAKTKWVAEQLVMQAEKRGLAASIYRPGLITGHSRTGVCNLRDSFSLMLRACLRLGVAPELTGITYLTPVDFVSRAILQLSRSEAARGKAFHINNPVPVEWQQVIGLIVEGGYAARTAPYKEWLAILRAQARKACYKDLEPIAALMHESPSSCSRVPAGSNMEVLSASPELKCPADNAALLRLYLSYLSSLG